MSMHKGRLEAFSDGVIAIIITIMVLELKAPHGSEISSLRPLIPIFLSYVLSFIYLGIYWNNHHHLLQASKYVNGQILWANLHLLFWLSLIPFTTAWMGENNFSSGPVALYGVVLFLAGFAYLILAHTLKNHHENDSLLAKALGKDHKGKISVGIYLFAVLVAFVYPLLSCFLYVVVALIWFIPDSRIEKLVQEGKL